MDGFYSQMHDSGFSREFGRDLSPIFDDLKRIKVSGIDMESSCLLTLGQLMGVKTCILTMTTVLENLKKVLLGEEREKAEDLLCKVALEGIYRYQRKEDNNHGI